MNANDYDKLNDQLTAMRENEPEYGDNDVDWALREPLAQWHAMVTSNDPTKVDKDTLRTLAVMLHAWWEDFDKPLTALAIHPETSDKDVREYYAYVYDDADGWFRELFTGHHKVSPAVFDTIRAMADVMEADLKGDPDKLNEYGVPVRELSSTIAKRM